MAANEMAFQPMQYVVMDASEQQAPDYTAAYASFAVCALAVAGVSMSKHVRWAGISNSEKTSTLIFGIWLAQHLKRELRCVRTGVSMSKQCVRVNCSTVAVWRSL